MHLKFLILMSYLIPVLLMIGCAASNDISNVTEYQSQDHKQIYTQLKKERENFNKRKKVSLENFTDNAEIMVKYNDGKIIASPQKLKEIWPDKIDTFNKHKLILRTIEVENLKIQNDKAKVKTKRTYYSKRWSEYYNFKIYKVYKKVDGEWKLHKSNFQEI